MRNFPKPTDSISGIQKYWFVPVNDVAVLGDIILNELQSITFETDKDWLTGYGVYDSKTFREDKKENKAGIRFLRSLKIFYPGFDNASKEQMAEMQLQQFIIAYRDFNGNYKVAGTLENPLNFKYKLNTGASGADAKGFDMEFFADSKIRIMDSAEEIDPGPKIYDDWFLPSRDELEQMYINLHLFGVGNFGSGIYWSSSEQSNLFAYFGNFNSGSFDILHKTNTYAVRAVRSFTGAIGQYSLRDVGPAGGLICYINGTTYYEAAPNDQSTGKAWSNITATLIGTTGTAIGTGEQNTQDIINQPGHTDSAAKLCDDLSITN
jgi:hypothetical protein